MSPGSTEAPLPSVGIVVLNWRNLAASRRCLASLESRAGDARVVLVDNASGDGSLERLREEFEGRGPVFIANATNLGFAAGCNVGIARALADGCDAVLLLNNDCVVEDADFLDPARHRLAKDPGCGIVGGKVVYWPETGRIWSVGGFRDAWGRERYPGFREMDHGQFDAAAERGFVSGAFMLIRRELIERIGPLPDAYFFGMEDWEYSRRAQRAGFRLVYEPRFRVAHEASSSHDWLDPAYAYNGYLSKILYHRRNTGVAAFALWWMLFSVYARLLFPLRYRLRWGAFRPGLSSRAMEAALHDAVRDAPGTTRITADTLEAFRRRHPDLMRRPAAPDAPAG